MKAGHSWNYTPYAPFDRQSDLENPMFLRLAPQKNGFQMEWYAPKAATYTLFVREREGKAEKAYPLTDKTITVSDLSERETYILRIDGPSGTKSRERLLYTMDVPGTVINYLHPEDPAYIYSGKFLCSPSLVIMPSGKYIVSMDVFNRHAPQNHTILFESTDQGKTWQYLTEIHPLFWGKLFLHRGELYLLGVSGQYANVIIGKSTDEGKTWSTPVILFYGSSSVGEGFHRAPCVIEEHDGRLWTSMEYGSAYINGYCNCVLSADMEGDLLSPESWTISSPYRQEDGSLAIEGNVITAPDGTLINFLRYKYEEALLLRVNTEDFHAPNTLIKKLPFPMARTKFEIKRHKNGKYYALGNDCKHQRTKLSVYSSPDLMNWKYETAVLDYSAADTNKVGFQYPVFEFEEEGFLVISRTAFGGATCYHDNNLITCHRIPFDFSK
ncbi:MAG: exo-alpha-sialidase [Clostridia bacterium]|nr:exo-alpha-sialidase [Clostridia bacterium]